MSKVKKDTPVVDPTRKSIKKSTPTSNNDKYSKLLKKDLIKVLVLEEKKGKDLKQQLDVEVSENEALTKELFSIVELVADLISHAPKKRAWWYWLRLAFNSDFKKIIATIKVAIETSKD